MIAVDTSVLIDATDLGAEDRYLMAEALLAETMTAGTVLLPLQILGEFGRPFWDALIWAICERSGAEALVSEEFQDGRRLGRVTILDPFNPANAARLGLTQG